MNYLLHASGTGCLVLSVGIHSSKMDIDFWCKHQATNLIDSAKLICCLGESLPKGVYSSSPSCLQAITNEEVSSTKEREIRRMLTSVVCP